MDTNLKGYYYDPETRRYFKIAPDGSSNPLTRETVQRLRGHEQAGERRREIQRRNGLSFSEFQKLRQESSPTGHWKTSLQKRIIRSAMSRLTCTATCHLTEVLVENPVLTCLQGDVLCSGYSIRRCSTGVLSTKISPENGGRFVEHRIGEVFKVGKIVDLKPLTIEGAPFVAVARQHPRSGPQMITIGTVLHNDRRLVDHRLNFESQLKVIWSMAVTPTRVAVGSENLIELWTLNGSVRSVVKCPRENVFVLENEDELLFAGTNKGNIHMIDLRTASKSLKNALTVKAGGGLSNLKVSGNYIAASCFDDRLSLFDRRFAAFPLVTFAEHRNDCSPHLSLVLNERLGVVASAGTDNVIRLWSLGDHKLTSWISDQDFTKQLRVPCFAISEDLDAPCTVVVANKSDIKIYR